jgi:hypothetical protein
MQELKNFFILIKIMKINLEVMQLNMYKGVEKRVYRVLIVSLSLYTTY